jgi:formylglycine-generating enzyme required for sulfatase activity
MLADFLPFPEETMNLTRTERDEGLIERDLEYRLPTDAEWTTAVGPSKYPWGDTWPPPKGAGNYAGEEFDYQNKQTAIPGYRDDYARTAPVGSFSPNSWGLYDIGGNVWEWCLDPPNAEAVRNSSFGKTQNLGDALGKLFDILGVEVVSRDGAGNTRRALLVRVHCSTYPDSRMLFIVSPHTAGTLFRKCS